MLPTDLSIYLGIGLIATASVAVYCYKKQKAEDAALAEGSYAYDQIIYVDDPEPVIPASPISDL